MAQATPPTGRVSRATSLHAAAKFRVASRSVRGITMLELTLTVAIVAILAAVATPAYERYRERIRVFTAVKDIGAIASQVSQFALDNRKLPNSLADAGAGSMLDPWGHAYQYVNHDEPRTRGRWRRDKNIVPINTDFDVFSMGKDGTSTPPLTARSSRDDIVRANDGRFIGLASDYDP
jgi:general secretion pathway protein G